jgi:hypothetical protein
MLSRGKRRSTGSVGSELFAALRLIQVPSSSRADASA